MPRSHPHKHRTARRGWRALHLVGFSIGAAFLGGACLTATQIKVRIATNALCIDSPEAGDKLKDVAILAGSPQAVQATDPNGEHPPQAKTSDCGPPVGDALPKGYGPQEVGTLVVIPSGDRDVPARIVVVGRVEPLDTNVSTPVSVEACIEWSFTAKTFDQKDPAFAGCIVSRRNLAFIEHTALDLPIQLDTNCAGVVCDADSTCVDSRCVSATPTCDADHPLCNFDPSSTVSVTTGSMTSGSTMTTGGMTSGSGMGGMMGSSSGGPSSNGVGGSASTSSNGSSTTGMGGAGATTTADSSSAVGVGGAAASSSSSSSSSSSTTSGSASSSSSSSSSGTMLPVCNPPCGNGCVCTATDVCDCAAACGPCPPPQTCDSGTKTCQ
ncbi:MAG: hypothetical protein U0414_26255 [Polyangiaceae bacterium]